MYGAQHQLLPNCVLQCRAQWYRCGPNFRFERKNYAVRWHSAITTVERRPTVHARGKCFFDSSSSFMNSARFSVLSVKCNSNPRFIHKLVASLFALTFKAKSLANVIWWARYKWPQWWLINSAELCFYTLEDSFCGEFISPSPYQANPYRPETYRIWWFLSPNPQWFF